CEVDRYNVLTGVWETLPEPQTEFCVSDHSGVAADDGTIYLFGGWNSSYYSFDHTVVVTVDGDSLTYSTEADMIQHRGDHVCTRYLGTDMVYCMGGFYFDGAEYRSLASVEIFDLTTKEWTSGAPMTVARADFAVGILNGRITVMGGEDENGPMEDME
ncbi:unnamed protein product, partial [Discosporangium mesarthrocarpum]